MKPSPCLSLTLGLVTLSALSQPAIAQYFTRGSSGGGATMGGSAPFGGSLPFGGGTTQFYNPQSGYGTGNFAPGAPFVSPNGYIPGTLGALPPYPINAAQASMTPGFYHLGGLDYWRAPSGYYYPWGLGATTYGYSLPTYFYNQAQLQPVQQSPPLYSMFSDMQQYLDQSKKDARVADLDYKHLYRRLQDLRGKYDHLIAANGTLDPADEESLRKDAALLGSEIAVRVKPLPADTAKSAAKSGSATTAKKIINPTTTNKSGWVD